MHEKILIHGFEQFRHPVFPFIYIIDDKTVIPDVIQKLKQKPLGLETGFGNEPVRHFLLDNSITWIATEPDSRYFRSYKEELKSEQNRFYGDLPPALLTSSSQLFVLNTYTSSDLLKSANTFVYRNLDYRDMNIVPFNSLNKGQRFVFIVNMLHVDEMYYYRSFLKTNGYNPDSLKLRSKQNPPLTSPYNFAPDEYVLDVVKE